MLGLMTWLDGTRSSVRRGLGGDLGAEHAAGAAAIIDHDRLTQARTKFLAEHTGDNVGAAARRIRDNEPNRPIGKCVRGPSGGW